MDLTGTDKWVGDNHLLGHARNSVLVQCDGDIFLKTKIGAKSLGLERRGHGFEPFLEGTARLRCNPNVSMRSQPPRQPQDSACPPNATCLGTLPSECHESSECHMASYCHPHIATCIKSSAIFICHAIIRMPPRMPPPTIMPRAPVCLSLSLSR